MTADAAPPRLADTQLDEAAGALSRAFFDDPLQMYMLPDAAERERLSQPFFSQVLQHGQLAGEVYTTPGQARAAAVWMPPRGIADDGGLRPTSPLMELLRIVGVDAMHRFDGVMDFLDPFHRRDAPGPHWYLGVIGVDPDLQGTGVGRRLVEHVVSRADADGVPCYLETAQPKNVQFYVNRGFEVKVDTVEPDSGLRLWTFLRTPP